MADNSDQNSGQGKLAFGIRSERNKEIYTAGDSPFAPVNIDLILKKTDLLNKAVKSGKNELPESVATELGGDEKVIEHIYQQIITGYAEYTSNLISTMDARLRDCETDAHKSITDAKLINEQFDNEIRQFMASEKGEIEQAKNTFKLARQTYYQFIEDNRLKRPAYVKSTPVKVMLFLFLVFIVCLEAGLNSSLFATNMEGGLFQGILVAGLCSVINAGLAYFIGRGLRYLNHIGAIQKAFGFFCAISFVCVTSFVGLFVGHYRDALQKVEEGAEVVALQTFQTAPLHLADMYSWILFAITCIMAVFAAVDGYSSLDPYPGYETAEKKFREDQEEYQSFVEQIQQSTSETKNNFLTKLDSLVERAKGAVDSIKTTTLERSQLLNRYANAHKSAQASVKSILGKYRAENLRTRTTPPPAYFDNFDNINFDFLPQVTGGATWSNDVQELIKVNDKKIADLDDQLSELLKSHYGYKQKIIASYTEQCGSLKEMDDETIVPVA